ncbi:MAG: hypothetical protein JSR66_10020 [Proteobacteria bacterium]|nr:hypothetical protein [Pseudomonadota bacterium]
MSYTLFASSGIEIGYVTIGVQPRHAAGGPCIAHLNRPGHGRVALDHARIARSPVQAPAMEQASKPRKLNIGGAVAQQRK